MKYPKPLRKGNTIGICAPSAGVPERLWPRLDKARANLQAMGYLTVETPSVRNVNKLVCADAATRAAEFMSLYENPEVTAILPPWGGEFLMDMLPLLDFKRLSLLPAKWVCGYSDITTLLFALTLRCDMATLHGSNLVNMGYHTVHPSDLTALTCMEQRYVLQRSAGVRGSFASFDDLSAPPYEPLVVSPWKSLRGDRHGFCGRVLGGCMDVLCKLIGTPYAPVDEFLTMYQSDGFIWALESCEMRAPDIYRTLWQMRACGWFEHCHGIIIGRPDGYADMRGFTLEDALTQSFSGLDFPILYDADIGHIPPQMQWVNGTLATVVYEEGRATVAQTYI